MALLWVGGCTSSNVPGTALVGSYSAAPAQLNPLNRPRVGIGPFQVEGEDSPGGAMMLADAAADEMGELLGKAGRFTVIDRSRTGQLLAQQNAADALTPGTLIHPVKLQGVDYLLLGSLSHLSIARTKADPDMLKQVQQWIERSAQNEDALLTVHCGVGLRLIDPATGTVALASSSEFARTAPAKSLGLDVMKSEAQADTPLPLTPQDRRQIVRLALDDAVRKWLPATDRFLADRNAGQETASQSSLSSATAPGTPAPVPGSAIPASPAPATAPPAEKNCPVCGAVNDPAAQFCKQCGAKLP
jgi:hypothetical protein